MTRPGRAIVRRAGALLLPGVAVVWAIAATVRAEGADPSTTALAGTSVVAVATVATGWIVIVAGVVLVAALDTVLLGLACSALGVAWFAPALVLESALPAAGQLVASWAGSLAAAAVIVVVALVLRRRPASDVMIAAIAAAAVGSVATILRTWFSDPFRDLDCRLTCAPNPFVIADLPWARGPLTALEYGLTALCCITGIAMGLFRTRDRGTGRTPRSIALAALLAWAVADSAAAAGMSMDVLRSASVLLATASAVTAWLQLRARRSALSRIAAEAELTASPDGIRQAVASALDDPTVRLGFRLRGSGRLVDAAGDDLVLPDDQRIVRLARGDRIVALVSSSNAVAHDASDFGPTLILAIENEALRLELQERLDELRTRRREIVRLADAQRLSLERDLHDGAQQGLLGILLELHALRRAESAPAGCAAAIDEAAAAINAALTELRVIAHGIHPPILASAGLDDAVRSLAVRSRIPLEVAGMSSGRLAPEDEQRTFRIIADAVEEATAAGATSIELGTHRDGRMIRLDVRHDAALVTWSDLLHDRVGASGGRMSERHGQLEVTLPCA